MALELTSDSKKPRGGWGRLESKGQEAGIGGQEPVHKGAGPYRLGQSIIIIAMGDWKLGDLTSVWKGPSGLWGQDKSGESP